MLDATDGTPAGFFRFSGAPPVGVLDALFVDPPHIGTGLGGVLQVGESPSGSIPGRVLPRMRFQLSPAETATPD